MTKQHRLILVLTFAAITLAAFLMTSCSRMGYANNRHAQHTSCDHIRKEFVGYGPGGY